MRAEAGWWLLGLGALVSCRVPPVATMVSPPPSAEEIANPERGFFAEVGDPLRVPDFRVWRNQGLTMLRGTVRLDSYRNADLDPALLENLRRACASIRQAGLKIVLRFAYNDGPGEDAPLSRVLGHIRQLEPVLIRNADVVFAVEAGFIGAWGEWHGSSHGLDEPAARHSVLQALLHALPGTRSVLVRRPFFKQEEAGGPLTEREAFGQTDRARLGHYNDCFLAGPDDAGTYRSSALAEDKAYLAQDARFVPFGGETCAANLPRTGCAAATSEMQRLHMNHLNIAYAPPVIAGWRREGCLAEIRQRLGYRYLITSLRMPTRAAPRGVFTVDADIANVGYGTLLAPRPVFVVLLGGRGRWQTQLTAIDPRRWAPGTTTHLRVQFGLPSHLDRGAYTVALWLPDEATALQSRPEYAVRLANLGLWDERHGWNRLTSTLHIDPALPMTGADHATTLSAVDPP